MYLLCLSSVLNVLASRKNDKFLNLSIITTILRLSITMAFPSGITNQYVIPIHQDAAVLKDSLSSLPFQIFEKALLCQKCKNYYNPHPDTAVYFILKKIKTRHPNIK